MLQGLVDSRNMRNMLIAMVVGVTSAVAMGWFFMSGSVGGMFILGLGATAAGVVGWMYGIRSVSARQQAEDALSVAIAWRFTDTTERPQLRIQGC